MPELADPFEAEVGSPGALDLEGGHIGIHGRLELMKPPTCLHLLLPDLLHEVKAESALSGPLVDLDHGHGFVPGHEHVPRAHITPPGSLQLEQDPLDEPAPLILRFLLAGRVVVMPNEDVAILREERERRVHFFRRKFELGQGRSNVGRLIEVQSCQFVLPGSRQRD